MKMINADKGITLIEVMIAMAIIIGMVTLAYRYHSVLIRNNTELLQLQESLLADESAFDQYYWENER